MEISAPVILVATLAMAFVVAYRCRALANPLSLMIFWWGGWLWVATHTWTLIFVPSVSVREMTLLFLVGLTVGGLLPRLRSGGSRENSVAYSQRFEKLQTPIIIATGAMIVPAFVRGLYGLVSFPADYKGIAFGSPEQPGFVFRSNTLESLYFLISPPLVLFLLFFGIALFFQSGRKSTLLWALTFTFMDSMMRLARVNLYLSCLLVFTGAIVILSGSLKSPILKATMKRIAISFGGLVVVVAIVVGIGSVRNDRMVDALNNQFDVFVIDYHTLGFALIDTELENPKSDLNTRPTYGRLTIGGLESLATIVIRRFDKTYNSPALANAVRMSEYQTVGQRYDHGYVPKKYNSFYTILYTFYSDARFLGLFLGGLLLGWLTFNSYLIWIETRQTEPLIYVLFLLSIVLLGLFVSPLENTRTWLVAIGLALLKFWPRLTARLKSLAHDRA